MAVTLAMNSNKKIPTKKVLKVFICISVLKVSLFVKTNLTVKINIAQVRSLKVVLILV
jgi:hypothetical protein